MIARVISGIFATTSAIPAAEATSCGQALHRFDVDADETGPLPQQPHSMNPDRGNCA